MSNRKVNSITYGAIFCALIGVLLIVNRQFANFLDVYLFWIIPIPVIIYSIKFGSKQALIMDCAVLGVALICTGFDIVTMTYTIASLIAGTVYGWGLIKEKSAGFLIGSVVIVSLIVMFVSTFLFSSFFGYNITEEVEFARTYIIQYLGQTAQSTGVDVEKVFTFDLVFKIYVIICVLSSLLEGVLVHLIAYIVLRRLKMKLPPMKSISEMYAPMPAKLFVFASFIAYLAAIFTQVTQYNNIIVAMMIMSQMICVVYGYIFTVTLIVILTGNKKFLWIFTFILIVFFQTVVMMLVTIGAIDMFTNTRKRLLERVRASAK